MPIIRFAPNDGGFAITGANIKHLRDGAGVIFWTAQISYSGRAEQVVYRIEPSGAQSKVVLPKVVSGRGDFVLDSGQLYLDAWAEGEGKVAYGIPVPGWTPYPAAGVGPQGPQGPKGDTGPQGPAGAPGSGGALDEADRKALSWIRWLLGPLAGDQR